MVYWKSAISVGIGLFFLSLCAEAQMVRVKERKSGYLGRYNCISVTGVFGPSIEPQSAKSTSSGYKLSANTAIRISLERAIKNSLAIEAYAEYSQTSANILNKNLEEEFDSYFNPFEVAGADGLDYLVTGLNGSPSITEHSAGISIRRYILRSGAIAPVGSYVKLGAAIHRLSVDMSPVLFELRTERNYVDDQLLYESVLSPLASKTIPRINLGFGKRDAISRSFLIDYGVDFGLLAVRSEFGEYSKKLGERIEYAVYKRMRRKHFSNIYIGATYVF